MKRLISLAALGLITLSAAAGAQTAETVIDRAVSAYRNLNTMRAEFRQTLTNPLTGTTQTTTGEIMRKKPNLMSITFNNGDRVTADGSRVWVYLPSSVPGQVIRMSYASGNPGSVDPVDQFLDAPRTRYTITSGGAATVGGRATQVLNLVSKRKNDVVARAKLWIDDQDYSVRQFEVENASGLKRKVVITSFNANPRLDRSKFRFTVPRGAKIVDQNTVEGGF
jgi:outer membrane lipoprotein carrier protein